jgi:hypothetical protein
MTYQLTYRLVPIHDYAEYNPTVDRTQQMKNGIDFVRTPHLRQNPGVFPEA